MTPRMHDVEEVTVTMIGAEMLRGCLIAAAPIPLDGVGELHRDGLARLIATTRRAKLGGVAIGTTLSRWTRLASGPRAGLLTAWREGLDHGQWLVAPAGAPPDLRRPPEIFEAALGTARQARDGGADLLLVEPPGSFRGRPDRDRLVLEYHAEVAQAGLPMLASYRKEASGGIGYHPEVLAQLLARPEILGIEVATLDGIVAFQQVEALVRELAPTKVVVSGEERFLGYSLMCGADAALVGIACVRPALVADLLDAHFSGDATRFLDRSRRCDRLARTIFAPPMEAVPLKLLWAFVQEETLPFDAAHDPWGNPPGRDAFDHLARNLLDLEHDFRPLRDDPSRPA